MSLKSIPITEQKSMSALTARRLAEETVQMLKQHFDLGKWFGEVKGWRFTEKYRLLDVEAVPSHKESLLLSMLREEGQHTIAITATFRGVRVSHVEWLRTSVKFDMRVKLAEIEQDDGNVAIGIQKLNGSLYHLEEMIATAASNFNRRHHYQTADVKHKTLLGGSIFNYQGLSEPEKREAETEGKW